MSPDPAREARPDRVPPPNGYRQGLITSITVFLGFSLVFIRFWSFEASGDWTVPSSVAATLLAVSIVLQIVALWRSLQVEDDDVTEYKKTLRWFLSSIIVLSFGLLLAAVTYSDAPGGAAADGARPLPRHAAR